MNLELLAGPAALAVAASLAVAALWRQHTKDVAAKDAAILSLTASVREFPAALKDLTAVVVDAAKERAQRRD